MKDRLLKKHARLEELREELLLAIKDLPEERLMASPAPGKWSAAQIVDHIATSEGRSVEYILKKTQAPDTVPPAGFMCGVRTFSLVAALSSPLRFRTPAAVSDVPDSPPIAESLQRWSEVRQRLRSVIEDLPDELLGRALFRHPVAGRMNMSQTLDFMTAHLKRHSSQLKRAVHVEGLS